MLDDCTHGGFPEAPGIVVREDAFQGDCFRYRAACRQRAEANETAKGHFGAHIHLEPVQYEDRDRSADEIGKGIQSEADVAD